MRCFHAKLHTYSRRKVYTYMIAPKNAYDILETMREDFKLYYCVNEERDAAAMSYLVVSGRSSPVAAILYGKPTIQYVTVRR